MKLVGSAGFEPATFAVSGRRPNQASPTLRSVLDDEPRRDSANLIPYQAFLRKPIVIHIGSNN